MSKKTLYRELRWGLHSLAISLAIVGALGYVVSMWAWGMAANMAWRNGSAGYQPDWWEFRHAVAAPLLFGVFVTAILMRKRARVFRALLAAAFTTMVLWSLYDCYHEHCQIRMHSLKYGWDNYHVLGRGARHVYFNWPWLTDLGPWLPHK